MDGLDRVTLGVRLNFGQKLQGEEFDTSKIHILVTLQVSPCTNYPSDRLNSFTLLLYLFSAHLHKKFQLSVSILRASKALREPEGGVYSVGGCIKFKA